MREADAREREFTYMGRSFGWEDFLPVSRVMEILQDDPTGQGLQTIRNHYWKTLAIDPIWNDFIGFGYCIGMLILPVREGFLGLPYVAYDQESNEQIHIDGCRLLGAENLQEMMGTAKHYMDEMSALMEEMEKALRERG